MAQGDANKVWMIPTDFSKALEGFARQLGVKGDDGVFRYEAPAPDTEPAPEEDDAAIADWFDTSTDPEIAEAVRAAEAVARKEVKTPLVPPLPIAPAPAVDEERTQAIAHPKPSTDDPGTGGSIRR